MNPRTGRAERVFVNLEAVYPNPEDSNEEYSFEELRARYRGWLERWAQQPNPSQSEETYERSKDQLMKGEVEDVLVQDDAIAMSMKQSLNINEVEATQLPLEAGPIEAGGRDERSTRPRKKRIMEVKAEAQTSKYSPTTADYHTNCPS